MTFSTLLLVLAAAVVHATWNFFLKKANANRAFWWVVYWITAAVSVPVLLLVDANAMTNVTPIGWLVIVLSAPIHICYGLVLQQGYRKSDYSIVYPTARGTGPLISVLAAVAILDNNPSTWGWVGIVAILVSIVLLALPAGAENLGRDLRVKEGLAWGTLTGVFIAGYTFCDAWAVQQATGLTPITFYFPSILMRAIIFSPFMLMRPTWKADVKEILTTPHLRKCLAIVTVGSPLAFLLVLFAMTSAPLAYVATTRELGMMLGVVVGGLLLKEKLTVKRLFGVAGMAAGVVLIGLAG